MGGIFGADTNCEIFFQAEIAQLLADSLAIAARYYSQDEMFCDRLNCCAGAW